MWQGKTSSLVPLRHGKADRLPALAAELVQLKVDVIVALYVPSALAAKQATQDIPIVIVAADPVETGIVSSLARPGANITGVSLMSAASNAKNIELFREMLPSARRVAMLGNSLDPIFAKAMFDEIRRAGGVTKTEIHPALMIRGPDDLEDAFSTSERASRRSGRSGQPGDQTPDRHGDQASPADRLKYARHRRYRRPDVIRGRWSRCGSARCQVCSEGIAGPSAKGHSDRTTHKVRVGPKSENRKVSRPYDFRGVLVARQQLIE